VAKDAKSESSSEDDPLLPQVAEYIRKFDFQAAHLIQKKFKIGFSRAEQIIKEIRRREL